jgi:hypothetical protein
MTAGALESRNLSSGAHSRDPLARNDGSPAEPSWLFENRIGISRGAFPAAIAA